jgi:guanine nucleotide exchange factor for Rho/Rac/Cdc42-like GTPase family protein
LQVELILNVNKQLLEDLLAAAEGKDDYESVCLGDVFKQLAPFLKTYTGYCNGYETAVKMIVSVRKSNKKFDAFLRKVRKDNILGLQDFLIKVPSKLPLRCIQRL